LALSWHDGGMDDETQPDQPADDLTVTLLPDWVQEAIRFDTALDDDPGD
jgi:hypothetical protein